MRITDCYYFVRTYIPHTVLFLLNHWTITCKPLAPKYFCILSKNENILLQNHSHYHCDILNN